jgi:hypothetical protein
MDNKKYYWLKLKSDFFDTEDLILLETMPDGVIYSNILLKLYLKSIQTDGKLFYKNRIPYNSIMLSQLVRHPVGVVEKAMKIFQDMELIEVLDSGAIYILDIQSFIGQSSSEADRKRIYRDKIKEEKRDICPDIVPQLSYQTSTRDKRIEIRDKRIENKNLNTNININNKEKIKKEKSDAVAQKERFNFDFVGFTAFEIDAITDWLEYKTQAKKGYKTQIGLNKLRNQLLDFKNNNYDLIKIIDLSIANNWAGLFAPKQGKQANSSNGIPNVERGSYSDDVAF